MHDYLFSGPAGLDAKRIAGGARVLGLASQSFDTCLEQNSVVEVIRGDIASANVLGISGTPTFVVGKVADGHKVRLLERVSGAVPAAVLAAAVERVEASVTDTPAAP